MSQTLSISVCVRIANTIIQRCEFDEFDAPTKGVLGYKVVSSMHPRRWNMTRSVKRRSFQAIVMLFLAYTGVDIAIPQYHRDESIRLDISRTLSPGTHETETAIFAAASESFPDNRQEDSESHKDEDCFCCCSHVVPSPVFAGPANAEVMSQTSLLPEISIPTAPLHHPYHPPRFA